MKHSPTTTFKHPHLQSFLKRYPTHQELLLHAAFPLALTPELLYCLRENFVPDSPWIAVSDILLFLCQPVGFQLDISENYLTFTTTAFEEMKVKCKDTQIIRYNQC